MAAVAMQSELGARWALSKVFPSPIAPLGSTPHEEGCITGNYSFLPPLCVGLPPPSPPSPRAWAQVSFLLWALHKRFRIATPSPSLRCVKSWLAGPYTPDGTGALSPHQRAPAARPDLSAAHCFPSNHGRPSCTCHPPSCL